jgi:hypothetical protein
MAFTILNGLKAFEEERHEPGRLYYSMLLFDR